MIWPIAVALNALLASWHGEVYGDLRLGNKFLPGAKITVTCAGVPESAQTDSLGSFRIHTKETGKCALVVDYENQHPSLSITLFEEATRVRLVLVKQGTTYALRRE